MEDDWRDKDLLRASPDEREEGYVRWRLEQHRDALRELAESAPVLWVAERCLELSRQIDSELGVEDRRFRRADIRLPSHAIEDVPADEEALEVAGHMAREIDQVVLPRRDPRPGAPQAKPGRNIAAPVVVIGAAIVFFAVVAALVWWSRSPEPSSPQTGTVSSGPTIEVTEDRPAIAELGGVIAIEPTGHDYGLIFRGQRATHTFEARNLTGKKLEIRIQRSQCRCLWYQYDEEIEAGGTGEITIAIDGGRSPSGRITETVGIVARNSEELIAEIHITAEIE